MSDFGLLSTGFQRKRYADIITEKEARARAFFGENVNLSESSPLGLFIRLNAWEEATIWQLAESVYNSAYMDTADGHSLDKVSLGIGITRRAAEPSTGEVTFNGDNDTVIPAGFLVSTPAPDDIIFETTEEVTIAAGTATASIQAVDSGTSGNVPAATITDIVNPTAGVDTATNTEPTTGGRNSETDAELRARYALSVAKGGASTIDSIRASLLEVSGVRAALVIENKSDTTDLDGRPPKSIEAYVLGGEVADIAAAILQTKAAGIQAYGEDTETVQDDAGQDHDISFTYADEIEIEVDVEVEKSDEYPTDGDELIRTAIIQYIGGEDEDGSVYAGLTMGQDVIYNKTIQTSMQIPGVDNVSITINKVGDSPGTADIEIELTEVAETDWEKVTVSSA